MRLRGGERSEPECKRKTEMRAVPLFGFRGSEFYGFLAPARKENRRPRARDRGGVRELVQPLDGFWPVRSPAGAARALCSKLEPLPERQPWLSARICKDELEHA